MTRLRVEPLETRDVPAGTVTADVVNGVLVLTGDDNHNQLSFRIDDTGVTLTPSNGTRVNDRPENMAATFPVAVGLNADLRDGDDALTLVATSDLILPKGATIALGDGANVLGLTTDGFLDLAGLTVTGGDGRDEVTAGGGAGFGSQITGLASIAPGSGGGFTSLHDLDLPGTAGVKVTAGGGDDDLTLTDVSVAKAVVAKLGPGAGNDVTVTRGQVAGLTVTSLGGALTVTDSFVEGNVAFTGAAFPSAGVTRSEITGTLTVKSTQGFVGDATVRFVGFGSLGGLAVAAVGSAAVEFRPFSEWTVTRDVVVTSRAEAATVTVDRATLAARNLTLTAREQAAGLTAQATGSVGLAGTLTVTGVSSAGVTLNTGGFIEAAGDVKATGRGGAVLNLQDASLSARDVIATSAEGPATLLQSGAADVTTAGRLTLTGRTQAFLSQQFGATMSVGTDLTVTSRDLARYVQSNANTSLSVAGNWTVRSQLGSAVVSAKGQALGVTGKTVLDGGYTSDIDIEPSDGSTFEGPVAVGGGTRVTTAPAARDADGTRLRLVRASLFWPGKDALTVTLGVSPVPAAGDTGGAADVEIGDAAGPVSVAGGLTIRTGGGADTISLRAVTVEGDTTLSAGAGADLVTIDDGTMFTGAVGADLGGGSDTLAVAQNVDAEGPVTFAGPATFRTGVGGDTLRLGRAGGAGSLAVFEAEGSRIDAGTGTDTFDDELGQYEGIAPGTGIVGWDDPT